MKKEERDYRMYLQNLLVAMTRIADYIEGYTFDLKPKELPGGVYFYTMRAGAYYMNMKMQVLNW